MVGTPLACFRRSASARGFVPQERIIQDRCNPQGDRAIRNVEHIPVVTEGVKVEKIGNLSVNQPVDQVVADGAADNQTQPRGEDRPRRITQPPGKPGDGHKRQKDKKGPPEQGMGGEKPIADPQIPHHHEVKKGQDGHMLARAHPVKIEAVEEDELAGLVERDRALWPYAAYRAGLAAAVLVKLRRR